MKEYDEGRIWFKKKGNLITVGLTEKILAEVGRVQTIALPVEGDEFNQDDVVCEVEGDSGSFEVITPFDGAIDTVNEGLNDDTEVLSEDPLDEGWLFRLKVSDDVEIEDEESSEE